MRDTVKNFLGKTAEAFKKIPAVPGVLSLKLYETVRPLAGRVLDRIPEGKHKLALFCMGGTVFLLILVVIVTLAARAGNAAGKNRLPETAAGPGVPAEDLFVPREPDFLPGLLPEREPRQGGWTVEDIQLFWKNPEDSAGRDVWRKEIGAAIDRLMESVP